MKAGHLIRFERIRMAVKSEGVLDFTVTQIPLYCCTIVLYYCNNIEEKICLTRGANTQHNIGLDVIVVTRVRRRAPNQRPIDSYDLQHGRDKLC